MTIRFLLLLFLVATAATVATITTIARAEPAKDWPKPTLRPGLGDAEIAAAIGDHAKALADAGRLSGVVVATKAGKQVFAKAYGFANLEAKTPNTLDTLFNIGSITKELTKVAIAQLAQAGKLSLDDTIAKHLPGTKLPSANTITLRQLLDHRSGMGDFFGPKYDAAPPAKLRELADFVPLFADEPLAFAPGTGQRYSNAGYIVLGLVIERLSGEKYRDYIAKHVLAPAGMTHTGFYAVDERIPNRATGYTRRGDGDRELAERVPNTVGLPGRPSSAGGTFSTAGDLLRYVDALLDDKLLSPKWTNWVVNGSLDDARRDPAIAIAGGAHGVNAAIELEGAWRVVVLGNYDPPSAMATARDAMAIIRGRAVSDGDGPRMIKRPPSAPGATELARDTTIPAQLAGHLFTVEAKINGKGPFRFAVDSGSAGMLHVDAALRDALQLTLLGEVMASDPSGKNPQKRSLVRVDSVELGGARFTGIEASVAQPRDGTRGVIGLALFGQLTATLDYKKLELRLGKQALAAGAPHVLAFAVEHGVPVIGIDAGGVALQVDVDTGSPATLAIPSAWATKLAFTGPPRVVGKGRTVSNEFEIRGADLRGELRVAGFAQASPRVDLVDVFPVANLGSRFLRDYAVTFDMVNRRIALAR